jgi:hypothetical protein
VTCSAKGERGRAPVMRSADRQSKRPRRGKPKGAPTRTIRLNPGSAGGLWVVCAIPVEEVAAETSRLKTRGQRRSRERTAPSRDQGPEGKPQERDRDETGPAGCGGSKASRGCETLGAQHDRWDGSCRSDVAPRSWQNAEGESNLGRSVVGDRGESCGRRAAQCRTGETVKGSPSLRGEPRPMPNSTG